MYFDFWFSENKIDDNDMTYDKTTFTSFHKSWYVQLSISTNRGEIMFRTKINVDDVEKIYF